MDIKTEIWKTKNGASDGKGLTVGGWEIQN